MKANGARHHLKNLSLVCFIRQRGFHVYAKYLNSKNFTKVYLSPSSTVAHLKMILSKKIPPKEGIIKELAQTVVQPNGRPGLSFLDNDSLTLSEANIRSGSELTVFTHNYLDFQKKVMKNIYDTFIPGAVSLDDPIIKWPGVEAVNEDGHITKIALSLECLYEDFSRFYLDEPDLNILDRKNIYA